MSILQLSPRIRVETPLGRGYAILVETDDEDTWWTVGLDNGAMVAFTQDRIRLTRAYGYRRGICDEQMKDIISER